DRARLLGTVAGSGRALLLHVSQPPEVGVDVSTGRTVWARPRGLGVAWVLPDVDPLRTPPAQLTFDSGGGVTEVVDAASGAVLRRAGLEAAWPPGYQLVARSVAGDRLFVARQQAGGVRLDAYDLGTLAHRWRTTLAEGSFFVASCGALLCA